MEKTLTDAVVMRSADIRGWYAAEKGLVIITPNWDEFMIKMSQTCAEENSYYLRSAVISYELVTIKTV